MTATPTLAVMAESDPFTAFFEHDWAGLGGWSLFVSLCLLIVVGAFLEWWVPGPRYKRLEEAAKRQSETLAVTAQTLEKQVTANEITTHFFKETSPKRKERVK